MSVNIRQRTGDMPDGTVAVDFSDGPPIKHAEEAAGLLIETGWDIQRYNSENGGRIILGRRLQANDSEFVHFTFTETGYSAAVIIRPGCQQPYEGEILDSWTETEVFPED